MNKIESVLFGTLATLSLQVSAQVGPAWAWHTGKITNDGNVSLKSSSGTSTYNAVINPTGAVAKTNQSAVTQPPTIIIQATGGSSGYVEAIPVTGYSTQNYDTTTCPAGYKVAWSTSMHKSDYVTYFNVAGTRFSFGSYKSEDGNFYIGWMADNMPAGVVKGSPTALNLSLIQSQVVNYFFAKLCTK